MRSGDGGELGPLLDEQAAYYQAIAGEYWDSSLDLPGGEELTAALDALWLDFIRLNTPGVRSR